MLAGSSTAIPAILLVLRRGCFRILPESADDSQQGQGRTSSQPDSKQAQQMQTVAKIMPLFMGFISWGFPPGLVLYFAISNLFRIGQQAVIFRMDGRWTTDRVNHRAR